MSTMEDEVGFDLAEEGLNFAMQNGTKYASVTYRNCRTLEMLFRNGSLSVISPDTDYGIAVRVATSGGIGFSATNKLNRTGVKSAVARAKSMAGACMSVAPDLGGARAESATWKVPQKIPFESMDERQKIDRFLELDSKIASATDLKSFRQIYLTESMETKFYVDSEGTSVKGIDPKLMLSYFITMVKGGDSEQVHRDYGYTGGYEALEHWNIDASSTDDVRGLQQLLENGKTAKRERMDLICGPEVTGIACHESCGHPMEADRIMGREASQAGKSFVRLDSTGERIGSEFVTIVDDPTIPNSYGYYEFDDEGVRARPRTLYSDGKINEFLQDRESGGKTGKGSNGAGRSSSFEMEPLVRMANTYLLPGDWEDEEMIAEVKRGIFLKSFTEWNIDDRRFNQKYVGREAYMIENGELTTPVRSPVLEITTKGLWSSVDAIGRNVKFFGGSCGKGDPMQGMAVDMGGPMMRAKGIVIK